MYLPSSRPRRLRMNESIREMTKESTWSVNQLVMPIFVTHHKSHYSAIDSMPQVYRMGLKQIIQYCKELHQLGIRCVCLFPVVPNQKKNNKALYALDPNCFYYCVIDEIKSAIPELLIMTDVALDPYSSDGHDGIVDPDTQQILNDETIDILIKMASLQASVGADIIGPSDMMDGRIKAIRNALEEDNFKNTLIMSYTAKYASAFYGPFRDALDSSPKKGDKKSYQMNPANKKAALREALLDTQEGADILMVKPGLPYLDIISHLSEQNNLPIAAYHVSGEYAMIKSSAMKGWINEADVVNEILTCFTRAGSQIILTYYAEYAAKIYHEKN